MRRMLKHELHTFLSFMGEAKPHDELSPELAGLVRQRHHCPCDTIGHAAMLYLLSRVNRTMVLRCTPMRPSRKTEGMRGACTVPGANSEKML